MPDSCPPAHSRTGSEATVPDGDTDRLSNLHISLASASQQLGCFYSVEFILLNYKLAIYTVSPLSTFLVLLNSLKWFAGLSSADLRDYLHLVIFKNYWVAE